VKRVLITGATGALGRAVVEQLKNLKGYQIFATSSRMDSSNDNEIIVFQCDLCNLDQITAAVDLAEPDLILHLGGVFPRNLREAYIMNVAPAANILELVHIRKLKTRVILIGSAAEYGVVSPEENPIGENHALFPVSVYGVSKAWQTQLLGFYATLGVDVICARIFNLFGPGISELLFPGRLQKEIDAVKSGLKSLIEVGSLRASRDYISTSEAARQLLMIATRGTIGNVYHIGSGQPITMRDFLIAQLELHALSISLIHESPDYSNHSGYDVPLIFANTQKTRNLEQQG